ncbi:tetratricopeptide repeat-containing sensor histidine kinase [Flavobacterium sp. HSC-61S13]|uniref:tetratricopeptide repeat-containing sensor histidine kinase n=1 Tax=Flavobacterium sp. HSC-61S13 TaxID=2910963 RepID=UPI0020A20B61|nr:tetratricopeptide repeat-containing sensor histidine kinase [Flavobacterium sp. HSC-61S13]MCP1996295.1 signal transduction histidine kinase [Flavobacterium sp. HSC-61S13]
MKSPYIYFLIFFLFIHCKEYNQEKQSTIYQQYISKLNRSTTLPSDQEKVLDSLSQLLSTEKNTLDHRKRLIETAGLAYNLGFSEKYYSLCRQLHQQSVRENDSTHIAQALYFIGDYHEQRSQLDSAFYYHSRSNKLYQKLNDTLKQVKTSIYKASILFDEGIYNECEAEVLKTLKLLNSNSDTRSLYECYNLLSITLSQNAQYKDALFYQQKALRELENLRKTDIDPQQLRYSLSNSYNNTGNIYDKLSEHDQARKLYLKGLSMSELKKEKPALYAMLLNNLGNNYMLRNQHKKAFPLLTESLKIRDSIDLKSGIITSKIRLGDYYIHYRDTTAALKYWKEAFVMAKENKSSDDIVRTLKLLSSYDTDKNQYYSDLFFKTQDSLKNIEILTRNKFARIEFETNEVVQKNEVLIRRISLLGLALGALSVLLLAVFFIFRLQTKNKRLRYLQEQQNSKEVIYKLLLQQDEIGQQVLIKERNRIAKELHDGIINTLFSIKLHIGQNKTTEDSQKEKLVADIEHASEQIRQISHDLKDNTFAQSNFSLVIQDLIDKQSTETTFFESLIAKNLDWSGFSYDQKINIYRLLQEGIQNILKHAQATRCFIIILENADSYVIKIQDNGIGFNTAKINKGIGLRNFEERVKELNGTWSIESKIGTGTTIKIVILKT